MARELLFRLTKKDFEFETFRAGGPGGQNQNKVETGVRIRHPASGAIAESRRHASQHQNKTEAFKRLANSDAFKKWHRIETSRRLGQAIDIEAEVDRLMRPSNLRIEGRKDGRWAPIEYV